MYFFRKYIEEMTLSFNKPIIFKNLYSSLRLQAITHYLPKCLFIVMKRNEIDNGHSLLEARKNVFGNYNTWFSMEPPNVQKLKLLPAHVQVIEQIRQIHMTINNDLDTSGVSKSQRCDLHYEHLCCKPDDIIEEISLWAESNQCPLKRRSSIPPKFTPRKNIRIERSIYDKMVSYSKRF